MNYKTKLIWLSFLIPILISLMFSACTPQKKLMYLQNKEHSTYDSSSTIFGNYHIKSNDNLYIQITSLTKTNFEISNTGAVTSIDPYYLSYTVDEAGNIELPMAGTVLVKGLTAEQAKMKVQDAIKQYVTNATVNLKILNYKITLLGEVSKPGTYNIKENRINILEALGQASDLTRYANRHKIMIIREDDKGQKNSYYIDLTDKRILYSEKYYVMHNDVIYVEPNKIDKATGFVEIPWSIILSTISTTVLIITLITR